MKLDDQVVSAQGATEVLRNGSKKGIQPQHAERLRMQLAALDTAQGIEDMDIPGFRLHPLKGESKGRWSIWVSGNWRVAFEFVDGHVYVIDYEDHH
jgi:toxin HigB-1